MKFFFVLMICVLALQPYQESRAAQPAYATEGERAVQQLNELIKMLTEIETVVERPELGRLFLLKKRSQGVLDAINKMGLSHMGTLRSYQDFIVVFRYSSAYLQHIRTKKTDEQLSRAINIVNEIAVQRGFDDSPYTQITKSTFEQIRELFLELVNKTGDPLLKSAYSDLLPSLGDVIVKGKEGDRPDAYEAGKVVYYRIKGLYPLLNAAYQKVLLTLS